MTQMIKFIFALLVGIILIAGCSQEEGSQQQGLQEEVLKQINIEDVQIEEPEAPAEELIEEQPAVEVTAETEEEKPVIKKEEKIPLEIQRLFQNAEKVTSYYYRYLSPAGPEYRIYAKGDKMRIDTVESTPLTAFMDTKEKTAAEYCLTYSLCRKLHGKIRDLDYDSSYIETPYDWLAKITEAKKLQEASFRNRHSLQLATNIGEVWIDKYYAFIYQIKTADKEYDFMDVTFDNIEDSDVVPPSYMA